MEIPTGILAIQCITGAGFAFGSGSVDAMLYDWLPQGNRTVSMEKAKGMLGAAAQTGIGIARRGGGIIAANLTPSSITITIVMGALAVSTAATSATRQSPATSGR